MGGQARARGEFLLGPARFDFRRPGWLSHCSATCGLDAIGVQCTAHDHRHLSDLYACTVDNRALRSALISAPTRLAASFGMQQGAVTRRQPGNGRSRGEAGWAATHFQRPLHSVRHVGCAVAGHGHHGSTRDRLVHRALGTDPGATSSVEFVGKPALIVGCHCFGVRTSAPP